MGRNHEDLTTNDFEAANIEFIQFWIMDPFNEDSENSSGGEFYFNLGMFLKICSEMEENHLKTGYLQMEIMMLILMS